MILNIKPVTRPQLSEVASLLEECLSEDKRAVYNDLFLNALWSDSEQMVAITCDKVIRGVCVCVSTPIPDSCEISHLYIHDEFRGMGFGRKLLSHCLREMRKKRCKSAYIWLEESNDRAASFFKKIGFDFDGRRRLIVGSDDYYEKRYHIDI